MAGHAQRVTFDPSGGRIVTVGPDGAAHLWDAIDGRPLFALVGPGRGDGGVTDAAFSPEGGNQPSHAGIEPAVSRAVQFTTHRLRGHAGQSPLSSSEADGVHPSRTGKTA